MFLCLWKAQLRDLAAGGASGPTAEATVLDAALSSLADDAPPVLDVLALSNLCVDVVQPVRLRRGGSCLRALF